MKSGPGEATKRRNNSTKEAENQLVEWILARRMQSAEDEKKRRERGEEWARAGFIPL